MFCFCCVLLLLCSAFVVFFLCLHFPLFVQDLLQDNFDEATLAQVESIQKEVCPLIQ